MQTNTDTARQFASNYASNYASPGTLGRELARFASYGHADGYDLLRDVEAHARWFESVADQYSEAYLQTIHYELEYLRRWIEEFHGRYAVTFYTTVRTWDGETIREDENTIMFDHLTDVAKRLTRNGVQSPDSTGIGPNTWLASVDRYQHPYEDEIEEVTAHPAHGFTDREWVAVVRKVQWR